MHSSKSAKCHFCPLLLLISMCGFGQSSQPVSKENIKINEVADNPIPIISLDTLTLSTDTLFKVKKNRKMNFVFQYYFESNFVNLHGWAIKDGLFGLGADKYRNIDSLVIKLRRKGKSDVSIGPNTYMGNQVLYAADVKKIYKLVKNKPVILHFIPIKGSVKGKTLISYKIAIPSQNNGFVELENIATNPSPPHQSFDNQ